MKVTSYAVARPAYYDRNSSAATLSFSNSAGPHGATTRWTATIAAGKKEFVEFTRCSVYRLTAPTVDNVYEARIIVSGVQLTGAVGTSGVVGTLLAVTLTGAITLYPGDIMLSETYDLSTGGTVYYNIGYRSTQFDA